MSTLTDWELIREFAERRSDAAFAELVRRHLDFVYASALRQVRKSDLAQDVTQAVFLLLARKAASLRRGVVLSGWLFRSTRFLAARALREENRRHRREQEAAQMIFKNQTLNPTDERLRELEPHLDSALASLGETDRNAILLRFFEHKRLHEVGEALGLNEEAAKKRVSRAVDKLHTVLSRRGLTLSGIALTGLLSGWNSVSAPAGLAQAVCSMTGAGAAATTSTVAALVAGGVRDWLWFQAKALTPWMAGAAVVILSAVVLFTPSEGQPSPIVTPPLLSEQTPAPIAALTVAPEPAQPQGTTVQPALGRRFLLNVLDKENSQPIADARVLIQLWGQGGVIKSSERITAEDGSCEFPVPDKPFRTFRVWLSAAGYVPLVMDWAAYEFTDSDIFHTCKLTPGVMLTGEVRDEEGKPVADATVRFGGPGIDSRERENIGYHPRFSTLLTDAEGRFRFDQIPPVWQGGGGITVGFAHPDFAPAEFWLRDATQAATNHLVVLSRGVEFRGTVVGPEGNPLPGATVEEQESYFGIETKADSEGRFDFPHAVPREYKLTAQAQGYRNLTRTILVQSNTPEVTFRLEATGQSTPMQPTTIRLAGNVVDAENSQPVPRFKILLDEHRGTAKRLLGESANGVFDWKTEIMFVQEYTLEVEAEGYLPQASDVRHIGSGDQNFEFRLKRGSDLTGVIYQPDGQPAVGASVGQSGVGFGMSLEKGGKLVNHGPPVNCALTDAQGRFSLKPMLGAEHLVVAHESGCALLPVASVTNIAISLQPWGTIEGMLYIGSNAASNQSVNVGFAAGTRETPSIPLDYEIKTDTEGKFRFTRVPPGVHRVQRRIDFHEGKPGVIGFSHGETVTVRPGETAHVVLGGKGIPVTGQLVLSPAPTDYDWRTDLQSLVQNRPDLPEVRWQDFHGDSQAFMRASSARDAQIAKYYLDIQPDGQFRADDVLPGNYTLKVKIHAPPNDAFSKEPWERPQREIGVLERLVEIPDTNPDESPRPLDLSVITIPITNGAPAPTAPKVVNK